MSASKHGLGRGLDALLPQTEEKTELPISQIKPMPGQPRQHFAEKELTELAYSIRLHGILQPLVVAPDGESYHLIAGERRLRAAKLAGLSHVPVHIRTTEQQHHYELALIENIQRSDLSPIEEAIGYQKLLTDFNLSQEELAKRVGKSRSKIANLLRLLQLPANMQRALQEGTLTTGHALAILSRPPEEREALWHTVTAQGLNVRQTEAWQKPVRKASPKPASPWLTRLSQDLGAKVEQQGTERKGKLVIHYHSREELDRLVETLTPPER